MDNANKIGDYVLGTDNYPYFFYTEEHLRSIIEERLGANRLTVGDIAYHSGVSEATIRKWLYGTQTIKYSTLERIIAAIYEFD